MSTSGRAMSWWVAGMLLVAGIVGAAALLIINTGLATAASAAGLAGAVTGAVSAVMRYVRRGTQLPRPSTPEQLNQAAAALCERLLAQWTAEAAARGITIPLPAQLRWSLTTRPVTPPLPDVLPSAPSQPEHRDSPNPAELDSAVSATLRTGGALEQLVNLYRGLRRKRLAIIGSPGSGKTATAILLILEELHTCREQPDKPVPFLASLASWNPDRQRLADWIAGLLEREHPQLKDPAYGAEVARQLVDTGRVALFLDAFDELAEEARPMALRAIDRHTAGPVVLASRPEEYENAVQRDPFSGAPVIELMAVAADTAADYLTTDVPPSLVEDWTTVGAHLRSHPDGPAAVGLSTALMLGLAREEYVAGPAQKSPTELLDVGRFPTARAVENHLLDALVPAAFPEGPPPDDVPGPHFSGSKARRCLGFLAMRLQARGEREIAWWGLPELIARVHVKLALGVGVGVIAVGAGIGVVALNVAVSVTLGVEYDLGAALWSTLAAGLVAGLIAAWSIAADQYAGAVYWPGWRRIFAYRQGRDLAPAVRRGLLVGLTAGLGWASVSWLSVRLNPDLEIGLVEGLVGGLALGLAFGLGLGFAFGFERAFRAPEDIAARLAPRESLAASMRYSLLIGLGAGVLAGLLTGLSQWLVGPLLIEDPAPRWAALASALAIGLGFGLIATLIYGQLGRWLVACTLLAARGRAPVRLMRFLDEAHHRGVLRQNGSVYEFRHARLQERLALPRVAKAPGADSSVERLRPPTPATELNAEQP